ncbi:EscU/YscU/HrcU family type III secretion system export apparatus switch protein [Micromonospora provocatoris]|uniref:EscU/YscU/HrcU family type III secretion system export apparatus switch protein n=1 Tax=Bacillati TaxID=1783272 RepID=UPI001168DA60|nr:EscU/YscU/HrcU family type III secretion system export apparatus switch protein [Lysinibacillus sp. CD3-6]QPQ36943.1 EscU/YscU/HrcU family type III secretion system export apparatus switch protein [Lysinibacillus sp. JNUCC-52]UED81325.1 EscU/YscU/HrcU family type III secretion system export apparatus switch protein [Lysinibacillus sp. CD3-6]
MSEEKKTRKEAIALTYKLGQLDSPSVVAKGKGKVAENILARANEHNVPIYEDPNLVQLLGQLDLNESIPEELYQAVAEVFAFIYHLDQEHSKNIEKIKYSDI